MIIDLLACIPLLINAPDYGGWIVGDGYVARTQASMGCPVVINSYCGSACTLYLNNPRACVTRRAVLAFHSLAPDAQTWLWHRSKYRPGLRRRIDAIGGFTIQIKTVGYPQTTWFARECRR